MRPLVRESPDNSIWWALGLSCIMTMIMSISMVALYWFYVMKPKYTAFMAGAKQQVQDKKDD